MKVTPIFDPLKQRQSQRIFFTSIVIIALIYFFFSISLSLFSMNSLPHGSLIDLILFGALKSVSTYAIFDWIILVLFLFFGGLLFANYSFYKCKTSTTAQTGLFIGLLATICPICILPVIGISTVAAFITKASVFLKIGALVMLIGTTHYVVNNKKMCNVH